MYIQLGKDNGPSVKETVYYAKAGISAERRERDYQPIIDPHQMEMAVLQSEINFHTAQEALTHLFDSKEAILVNQISVKIMFSLPKLTSLQMRQALFAKQMFHAGEIRFAEYIEKMNNLFQDRMDSLSEDLILEIDQCLELV